MRRKFFSILTALALCLSLLPATAFAADVAATDVQAGEERSENPRGTIITNVYGIVDSNKGVISNVLLGGLVRANEISSGLDSGLIDRNRGTVNRNFGQINSNYGTISTNAEKGKVRANTEYGTIETNQGAVINNMGHVGQNVPAGMDGYVAFVDNMADGIVESNSALVNNMGNVTTNEDGGVVYNRSNGRVETNQAGGTVYNFAAGASVETNHGVVYWAVDDIVGTNPEKASFSAVTTENNRKFIQEGCTVAAAEGYYFSETPTADNAGVVFENGAYMIKNIKDAPVTLTVTMASIADAVALVRVTPEDVTYYTDFQAAFAAAAAKSATVELLNNVTLPEGEYLTVDANGWLTLNCGDFTLSGSYGSVIYVNGTMRFSGGTLKNTGDGNAVSVGPGGTFNMSAGTLEAENPYTAAVTAGGSSDKPANVNIRGGSVGAGGTGLDIGQYTTVQLSGGTYGEIGAGSGADSASEARKAVTVPGLLAKGYAFFKDGQPVALKEDQHSLEGPVTVDLCTHAGAKATDNGNGTHDITCPACGYSEKLKEHIWDENNTCVCGARAVMKMELNNAATYFTAEQLDAAFAKDSGNAGATFTLLADVERTADLIIKINCTLDLNGKTVHSKGEYAPALGISSGATVTIRDQSQDHRGQVISEQLNALAVLGTVTLEGGTFTSNGENSHGVYVNSDSASLFVTGEHVTIRNTGGGYGLAVNAVQSVQLSAGTYSGGRAAIKIFDYDATSHPWRPAGRV